MRSEFAAWLQGGLARPMQTLLVLAVRLYSDTGGTWRHSAILRRTAMQQNLRENKPSIQKGANSLLSSFRFPFFLPTPVTWTSVLQIFARCQPILNRLPFPSRVSFPSSF